MGESRGSTRVPDDAAATSAAPCAPPVADLTVNCAAAGIPRRGEPPTRKQSRGEAARRVELRVVGRRVVDDTVETRLTADIVEAVEGDEWSAE